MNYRRIGKSGLKVSEISLGAWLTYGGSVENTTAISIVQRAIERGVNYIDIADIYARGEAEKTVGQAIAPFERSNLVISSKLYWPMSDVVTDRGLSRKHIFESVEASLKRIGIDYLDIYFCHRFDPETEVEEVVRAMDDLVHQGKVMYWGTSVWTAAQIERAVGEAYRWLCYGPSVEQPRYNMLDRHIEEDILSVCTRYGIGLTVWSPLAQGLLTGKYNEGIPAGTRAATTRFLQSDLTEQNIQKVRLLTKLAKDVGVPISHLALAWVLRLPQISCALMGATTLDQLEENLDAATVRLDSAMISAIDKILSTNPKP